MKRKYLYKIKESQSKDFPVGKEIITSDLDQRTAWPLISDKEGNEVVFYRIREITEEELDQKRKKLQKGE